MFFCLGTTAAAVVVFVVSLQKPCRVACGVGADDLALVFVAALLQHCCNFLVTNNLAGDGALSSAGQGFANNVNNGKKLIINNLSEKPLDKHDIYGRINFDQLGWLRGKP